MFSTLRRYCSRFRYVIKNEKGEPYLIRYRLVQFRWLGVYLHHILCSDSDRHLHDHPFDFITILLWNSYIEYTPNGSWNEASDAEKIMLPLLQVGVLRPWLSVIRHKATDLHRLELPKGPVWSLFIRGPRKRRWGFQLNNSLWVPHDEYQPAP